MSRPAATVTVTELSNHSCELVRVPLIARTRSAVARYTLSVCDGSPATNRTRYVPLGTASSHTAFGFSGFCRWMSVSYRWSGAFAAFRSRVVAALFAFHPYEYPLPRLPNTAPVSAR